MTTSYLPQPVMDVLFPFHIALDRTMRIREIGPGLAKLTPELTRSGLFSEHFKIFTPDIEATFEAIREQSHTVFFVTEKGQRFTLKGQMLFPDGADSQQLLFLASPVVREMADLSGLGLTLNDFAVHDSIVDFLVLLQAKANTINDMHKMAERLRHEVSVRREAEQALLAANEELEGRVYERTHALTEEIKIRIDAEEALKVANLQLKATLRRMECFNRQISILNHMGDTLQACASVKETHAVIRDSLQQLFPDDAGMLSLYDRGLERFEVVTSWGGKELQGMLYEREGCWGVRRGKTHIFPAGESCAVCGEISRPDDTHYICIPLTAQGETLGTINIHFNEGALDGAAKACLSEHDSRLHTLQTAAEHISLVIANLRLRETLHAESILDPLTKLYNRRHMEAALERESQRALRNNWQVGIIMLDVDHFKVFNDTKGHDAGDFLLTALGELLLEQVRGQDLACRYGGEEFLLILPGANRENTFKRAEQLRLAIEQGLDLNYNGERLGAVTASFGAASFPRDGDTAREVVMAADSALYRAKQEGRNRVMLA